MLRHGLAGFDDITRDIEEGPAGPEVGAFFDLDRTLIAGFSVFPLVVDGVMTGRIGAAGLALTGLAGLRFQLGQLGFSGLVAEAAGMLRGEREAALVEVGERLYADRLAAEVYPEARAIVRAHRRRGHTMAVVSSATRYQIEPLARDLGIEHVLCTRLEVRDGRFTGDIEPPLCYGEGKLEAARSLATSRRVDLGESFFYTDSHEDLPLLEHVGRPRPTNPNRRLATIAARRGWPSRTFRTRGLPSLTDVVRTSLSVASLAPSLLLGLPAGLLEGSWRQVINLAATTWGELGTALAGIRLTVTGEEHLWSHRPAVFIFNHQSAIDVLILCRLLHRDFVGISKQEVRSNPIFGPAFALAGTVFIDRSDRTKAIEALKPAVQALREGLSIAIAPEGTRSSTGRLGRFKKGAFHIAMAAKRPIVPIVIRNALDALPKHGIIARPATVDVVVHPPISTDDWTHDDLDRVIGAIEQCYRDTLQAWSS
jgi:putative phosphoserine phosphatase/1-acylglycerol-3-phosphate O-acyltransferase